MSIQSISFQADPFRGRFSPAPARSTGLSPAPPTAPLDQSHLNWEGDEMEHADSQSYASALAGNFAPGEPAPDAVDAKATPDLRAALKDWFPEYSSFLDLSSLSLEG